ncbi:MAG: IPTL-CTERM sorting domain-containing protein, partial [Myxococcales bacterium]|nr:IPTL-CTERM sorting domain-containing protein [Myxococcales bacterium]
LPALSNRGIAVLLVLLALTGASRLRRDSFSRA